MRNETYLGDGLYASFDGFTFELRAPREGGDHWVALEPAVMAAFLEFMEAQRPLAEANPRDGAGSDRKDDEVSNGPPRLGKQPL